MKLDLNGMMFQQQDAIRHPCSKTIYLLKQKFPQTLTSCNVQNLKILTRYLTSKKLRLFLFICLQVIGYYVVIASQQTTDSRKLETQQRGRKLGLSN